MIATTKTTRASGRGTPLTGSAKRPRPSSRPRWATPRGTHGVRPRPGGQRERRSLFRPGDAPTRSSTGISAPRGWFASCMACSGVDRRGPRPRARLRRALHDVGAGVRPRIFGDRWRAARRSTSDEFVMIAAKARQEDAAAPGESRRVRHQRLPRRLWQCRYIGTDDSVLIANAGNAICTYRPARNPCAGFPATAKIRHTMHGWFEKLAASPCRGRAGAHDTRLREAMEGGGGCSMDPRGSRWEEGSQCPHISRCMTLLVRSVFSHATSSLPNQAIVFCVRANPKPRDHVAVNESQGTIAEADSHRIQRFLAVDLFELQTRMR